MTNEHSSPIEDRRILVAAGEILRREAEKDTSRAANDKAEIRIAAAVCEAVAQRV